MPEEKVEKLSHLRQEAGREFSVSPKPSQKNRGSFTAIFGDYLESHLGYILENKLRDTCRSIFCFLAGKVSYVVVYYTDKNPEGYDKIPMGYQYAYLSQPGPIIDASQSELATDYGCSRQWFNEILKQLEEIGLIARHYRRIELNARVAWRGEAVAREMSIRHQRKRLADLISGCGGDENVCTKDICPCALWDMTDDRDT